VEDHLLVLGVDGRNILICISKKQYERMRIPVTFIRTRSSLGFLGKFGLNSLTM
jgi:hypothetical protein